MNKTNISWTDFSSNPVYAVDKVTGKRGWFCERVSPGCANCYASTLNGRWGNGLSYLPENADRVEFRLDERELDRILSRKKPARIFVCDMTDLFHERVPDQFIADVFAVMASAQQHVFQVLTKRPERMHDFLAGDGVRWVGNAGAARGLKPPEPVHLPWWPLPNVWLGVSAENQRWADTRIPLLLDTPAAVRFVSLEPLLGPIDLRGRPVGQQHLCIVCGFGPEAHYNHPGRMRWDGERFHAYRSHGLDWVIVGGESGAHYRPMDVAWAESLAEQCAAAGVPLWVKQDSGSRPGQQGRLSDALWARKEMPEVKT